MNTIYLDLETTGLADNDEILEVGIIDDDKKTLIHEYVKPKFHDTWERAERINNISPEHVKNCEPIEFFLPDIITAIKGKHVIIYNAPYDTKYLPIHQYAGKVSCCMNKAMKAFYTRNHNGRLSLKNATNIIGYNWDIPAHSAIGDCLACRAVWHYLVSSVS